MYAFRVLSSDTVVHNAFTTVSYAWLHPHDRGYLKHASYVQFFPQNTFQDCFQIFAMLSLNAGQQNSCNLAFETWLQLSEINDRASLRLP